MAIRLRHDAAALGSNLSGGGGSNRKYGQQLVMQQRKYDMDQMNAMQDRAFDMQKQGMQNAWQMERDFRNNLVERMAVEQEQDFRAKQAQEARQFNEQGMARQRQQSAFEGNVDMATRMAQEALKRDDVPGPVKERLRNLIGGAVAIRGKEFDDTQASKFAPEYYAGVSAALADVPPPVPIYEQMNKNLVYRLPDGISYVNPKEYPEGTPFVVKDVQSGKEWISSPAGQPQLTPFEAFAQENKKDAYRMVQEEMGRLSEKVAAGEMKFFESEDALRQAALRNVQSGFNLVGGMSSGAPGQPVAPTTTQSSSPQSPVVPQQSAVSPAVMNTVGNVLDTFPDTEMMAMSQLGREALVQSGMPQGQAQAPTTPIAPPMAMPTDRAGMVAAGMPQGGATATPVQQPPSQNPWEEFVSPPQQQASVQKTESAVAPSEATVSAPDFKKLSESATDSADKLVLGRLQSMYGSQPLDIQKAISAFVDPGSTEEIAGQAIMYLKNKGIDILQLGKPRKRKLPGMSQ